MICFPNAKINLGLRVLGKRSDGYHEISTLMLPVSWHDALEILPAEKTSLRVFGKDIASGEENLCLLALRLLEKRFNRKFPVQINLLKKIPSGAGLGGGSSDGAATLKLINQLFSLGITNKDLKIISAELGSDCPVFIESKPMIATGRGEVLSEINCDFSGIKIVIVSPSIHSASADAYNDLKAPSIEIVDPVGWKQFLLQPKQDWLKYFRNDFETTIFKKFPLIEKLKNEILASGAFFASLSGSGSSVYGLYVNKIPDENQTFFRWCASMQFEVRICSVL